MTQKQFNRYHNKNGKSDRSNIIIRNDANSGESSRRPILFSSENMERMAIESSRARLVMQLLSEPKESLEKTSQYSRDESTVGSIYRKPSTKSSRTDKFPVCKRNFTTYPSLVQQCLRWSPSIDTFSEDSQTDTSCTGRFKCKCNNCKMNNCLACKQMDTIQYSFKDNIVKFSDMSTMTRNVIDSGCGTYTPASTRDNSNVSIAPSDVILKNVLRIQTSQTDTVFPTSILKTDNKNNVYHIFGKDKKYGERAYFENTRTVFNDYDNLLKGYTKSRQKVSDVEESRRFPVNEGINGFITNNTLQDISLRNRKIKSQMKFDHCHRPHRVNKCFDKKTVIPHTHQTNSKYHNDCKEPNDVHNVKIHEDLNELVVSSILKPVRNDASIRLPKRVLTSERDIEAFMEKRPTKMSSIFKR